MFKDVTVGDYIELCSYPHDASGTVKPIEWIGFYLPERK